MMTRYSKPVWEMGRDALRELGGNDVWVRLAEIVDRVQSNYATENVNSSTIRCQIFCHCVNRHPTHDDFPDKGRMWQERRLFVTDGSGNYRLYSEPRDIAIYREALRQHGL